MIDESARQRWKNEREILNRIFDLSDTEREAFIADVETRDAAQADRLRSMLRDAQGEAQADADADHSRAATGATATQRSARIDVGDIVGHRFRVLRLLGAGGMGDVYLAERTDDVEQCVALKLVRSDLPVPVERARRERQILARLNHPNIAGLVDAGVSAFGQPWFAMDYVDGERITQWCDSQALDLYKRATLFAQVCRAVQFAHRNLVLHRDLKPSNILVDTEGVPKLLDFGIAKLLDVTDARQTQTLALTPAYASPEQLRGEAATTASDVYQLGLVLYEVLAGISARKARDAASSRSDGAVSLPRVDHALMTMATRDRASAERVARERGLGVDRLRRSLKGDIGRIVAKATAEDPRERYETAQAIADDLDRWTAGLPVVAHGGSFVYRAQKFIRRQAVASGVILILAIGLVAATVIAVVRARQAESERAVADQRQHQAESERQRADRQRQRAETLLGFMNGIFRQADPENTLGTAPTPTQMLERAEVALAAASDLDPLARAAIETQIADTFNSLFVPEKALVSARRAITLLDSQRNDYPDEYLASVDVTLDALRMLRRSEEQLELVDRAAPLAASAAALDRPWVARLLRFRGSALCMQGKFSDCATVLQASVNAFQSSAARSDSGLTDVLNELAVLNSDEGNVVESVELNQRGLNVLQASNGLKADIGLTQQNLASGWLSVGRFSDAMNVLRPLLHTLPAVSGADSIAVASLVKRNLAKGFALIGDYGQARRLINEVIADLPRSEGFGAKHKASAWLTAAKISLETGDLRRTFVDLKQATGAIPSHDASMAFMRARVDAMSGEALMRDDKCPQARALLEPSLGRLQALLGATPSWIAGEIADTLARCAMDQGDFVAAERYFVQALDQFRRANGQGSPSVIRTETHRLWARARGTDRANDLEAFEALRSALVDALSTPDAPQVWQFDLLVADLSKRVGRSPPEARTRAALSGLGSAGIRIDPRSPRGLTSFN